MPDVTLFEMSPRDGLQNEANRVSIEQRIALIDLLSAAGFQKIEAAAFVSPKWVPQMAEAADVLQGIKRTPGTQYTALTPNSRGLEEALAANADEVAVFASASEGFSQANINCSVAESVERFKPVLAAATVPVRGYVSCITDCPYDGPTAPKDVATLTQQLLDLGCYEVSLGDTVGKATPETLAPLLEALSPIPPSQLAGHFHDTGGRAVENVALCLDAGLRTFDASVAGLGGCPYAPGAKGNVATEALLDLFEARGLSHGIDRTALMNAAAYALELVA